MPLSTPVKVGTTIAGTYQDGPGHAHQSHLIYAVNAARWWLFTVNSADDSAGNPGTHLINAYYSDGPDLASAGWTKATSSPSLSASSATGLNALWGGPAASAFHGRAFGCAYVNNAAGSNKDLVVIYGAVLQGYTGGSQTDSYNGCIRAVVTSNAITWGNWGGWTTSSWNLASTSTTVSPFCVVGVTTDGFAQFAGCVLHSELDCAVCTTHDACNVDSWTEGSISATGNTSLGSGVVTGMSNQTRLAVGMSLSQDAGDFGGNRFPKVNSIDSGTQVTVSQTSAVNATATELRWWQGWAGSNRPNSILPDTTMTNECGAYGFAPLASGGMLLAYGDGAQTNGSFSDLWSLKANQTQAQGFWPSTTDGTGRAAVFGTAVTTDPHDWCLIPVSTANIYCARRTGTTSIAVRVYSTGGNTWSALGAQPPATAGTIKAAAGVVGATDGTDFWLFVIDGTHNTIIYCKFSVALGTWGNWITLANVDSTATKLAGQINANGAGGPTRNLAGLMYSVTNGSNFDTYVVSLKTAVTPPTFTFDQQINVTRPAAFRPGLAR